MRLVPYHCLGSLWSQRDKKGREDVCWSVRATVRQFNRLANTVLASCLWCTELRSQQRARLLEKWISVAEVRSGVGAQNMQIHVFVTAPDFSLNVLEKCFLCISYSAVNVNPPDGNPIADVHTPSPPRHPSLPQQAPHLP